jgi:hypothetical protein
MEFKKINARSWAMDIEAKLAAEENRIMMAI